ncbi:transketolase [Pseudodesulfovibrio sp.]|uniref:transketolase n=1 Tax=Pseudodesulfovibrio sp. TaxID=2035812 RepID=UPI0026048B96|nr:transketolase [Pseudodesulfovibrio sp.]MDD3312108.1 transketolase [Pseudodesulfovibrio sp.]
MPATPDIQAMRSAAREIRKQAVRMSHRSHATHLGSSLSCADVLAAAYWGVLRLNPQAPDDPERDRFILSKGHAAAALFATLALRGFFPVEDLERYASPGCHMEEHPSPKAAPGVEAATGSLGHGLPIGTGMALAARIAGRPSRVFVLMGDGEQNEGSVWEAAMFAGGQRLANLCAVIDCNRWQATGRSGEILALEPLADKWRSFGWDAVEVDGHDVGALATAMAATPGESGRPLAIVARTVKGKGVSFMEDDNNWHYRVPNDDELARALGELEGA